MILLLLFLFGIEVHAACSSPYAESGGREYFTGTNKYQVCDGSSWRNFIEGGTLTSCSTAGEMDFDYALSTYKYCNGTNWIRVGAPQCTLSSGQMTRTGSIAGGSDFSAPNSLHITEDGSRLVVIGRHSNKVMIRNLNTSAKGVSATINEIGDAYNFIGYGNHVFVASRTHQNMVVIDIGAGVTASYLSRVQAPNSEMRNVWALALTEDKSHIITVSWGSGASSNKCFIHAINVSNPASPSIVSTMNYTDTSGSGGYVWCNDIEIRGNTAFVNFDGGEMAAINISNPASMSIRSRAVGTNTHGSEAIALSVDGNYLYSVNFNANARFHVWNVSNPNSISYVSSIHNTTSFAGAYRLTTYGKYILVANDSTNALTAVDVTNPTSPVIVDTLVTTNLEGPSMMVPKGNLIYVAGSTGESVSLVSMGGSCDEPATIYGTCSEVGEIEYHSTERILTHCDGVRRLGLTTAP